MNLNVKINSIIDEYSITFKLYKGNCYGLVSGSPNVMIRAGKLCNGLLKGGCVCCLCVRLQCHDLSLFITEVLKLAIIKDMLKNTVKLALLFKNTHIASQLLDNEKFKLAPKPRTIRLSSAMEWGSSNVEFNF